MEKLFKLEKPNDSLFCKGRFILTMKYPKGLHSFRTALERLYTVLKPFKPHTNGIQTLYKLDTKPDEKLWMNTILILLKIQERNMQFENVMN